MYENLTTLTNSGINLVCHIVDHDYENAQQYVDRDDLVGSGIIGLLRASSQYRNDKGVVFVSFASLKIRQAINTFVRQKCQRRFCGLPYEYMEKLYSRDDYEEEVDRLDEIGWLRRQILTLPSEYRRFAEVYLLGDMDYREAMRALGLPKNRFFAMRKNTLEKLRRRVVCKK